MTASTVTNVVPFLAKSARRSGPARLFSTIGLLLEVWSEARDNARVAQERYRFSGE